MDILLGIFIPFIGTTLGALLVFFVKNSVNNKYQKLLLGFASGVMIAASVWSLLIPSIEMAEENDKLPWLSPTIGFLMGVFFLLILDKLVAYFKRKNNKIKSEVKKKSMLFLAITLHNIPEGMAVGVIFAGYLSGNSSVSLAAAFALAIGIAIQNFPEGSIISLPLHAEGMSKKKAFLYGTLSGVVEPIFAFITILLTNLIVPLMPYFLSFAAGCMMYVVVEELIPETKEGAPSKLGSIGMAFGFTIMMILDVALG